MAWAERALTSLGLQSRLPVAAGKLFRFRKEWRKNRNPHAWTFVNPARPSEMVDIVLTHDLRKMKTTTVLVRLRRIPVVALGDLIRMKRGAGREQDLADVKALESLR